jgi:hypothetical protein
VQPQILELKTLKQKHSSLQDGSSSSPFLFVYQIGGFVCLSTCFLIRNCDRCHSLSKCHTENAVKILVLYWGQTASSLIEGRWQLIYTTRPGTASPIQRTFVGVDAFTVFQEILLRSTDNSRVANIVKFSEKIGELKVEVRAELTYFFHVAHSM